MNVSLQMHIKCPEGSESSSQRLLFDVKFPVSQLEKDGDSTSRGQCMECRSQAERAGPEVLLRALRDDLRDPGTRMRTLPFPLKHTERITPMWRVH